MATDPKELQAALQTIQLASMGNPQAIQAIRNHHDKFSALMPEIQQMTAAAFQPGAGQVSDAEAIKAGVPQAQMSEARKVQGPAPQDAMVARYQEILNLLSPQAQMAQAQPNAVRMEPEVITASPKPRPKPAKVKAKPRYTPMSAPEGATDEMKLGAALLNILGGAGGLPMGGEDDSFQLKEPELKLPSSKKR